MSRSESQVVPDEQLYDRYVRSLPDETIMLDVEREIVPPRQVALALVRQRAAARERIVSLAAQVDALEQLLGMIREGR